MQRRHAAGRLDARLVVDCGRDVLYDGRSHHLAVQLGFGGVLGGGLDGEIARARLDAVRIRGAQADLQLMVLAIERRFVGTESQDLGCLRHGA